MTHSATAAGVSLFSGITESLRTLRAAMALKARRQIAYSRTYAQLDAMTDRDLADIGIARFMIADVAAEAASRI